MGGSTDQVEAPDFRSLFESAPGLYLVLKPDAPRYTIVAVSDAYARTTMTRREEIVGQGLFAVFPDNLDDSAVTGVKHLSESLARVIEHRAPDAMAVQKDNLRRPREPGGEREERWWRPVNSPVFGPDGRLRFIIHRIEDVTESVHLKQSGVEQARRYAELKAQADQAEALRVSEVRYARIISIAADAIIWYEEDRGITLFNEGAEKIFGYSKAEVLGAEIDILLPERFRARHREQIKKFLAGTEIARRMGARREAIVGLRKNGEEFPADASISFLEMDGQKTLTVVLRDISEHTRIESQQRFLAEAGALLASTLDYEDTLTSIAQLAVRELAEFCLVDVADLSASVFRLVVHRNPALKSAADALRQIELDPRGPRLASAVLNTQQPLLVAEVSPEFIRSVSQNDEHMAVLCALHPRSILALPLLAHGRLLGAMVLVRSPASPPYTALDIPAAEELSHRAALALHSARLYRIAQQATEARDEVLGLVAHDLRSLLSPIYLRAQILLADQHAPSRKSGQIIYSSAERMIQIIQDLEALTKLEAGQLSIEKDRISAVAVLSEAVADKQPLAASAKLTLRLEVLPDLPEVLADRERLLQVLRNLIGNAIKFTPPGSSITVSAAPADGAVRFAVADTGADLPAESLPHLFDRFRQPRLAGRQGVRLGLTVVKGIVEAHGGRIWVESVRGQGSTFFFTVPAAPA